MTAAPAAADVQARPLRVGIIGAGGIAQLHARGYQAAGCEIVAIADLSGEALDRRSAEWGVPHVFTDYRDLLAVPEIDAVSVSTPNAVHGQATIAAAVAGKHVLCEKPISLSLDEGAAMIEACRRAGVVLQVNHHMRASHAVMRTREMLDAGVLGRVAFIRLRQAHDWGGATEVPPSFRTAALAGGGTLIDNGCHLFDLALHLGGPVADVFARAATLKFATEVEDTAITSLRFASGALAEVETQWTNTGGEIAFAVYGTNGAIEYTNRSGRPVMRWFHREPGAPDGAEPEVTAWESNQGQDHTRAVAAFVQAIRGDGPVICTGEDGLAAARIVLAAYESAISGRSVRVDG